MGARMFKGLRPAALVLLTAGALLGAPSGIPPHAAAPTPVAALSGGSIWTKAACLGCAALLFGVGGATIGGVIIEAMLYPEAFGGCGVICLEAF